MKCPCCGSEISEPPKPESLIDINFGPVRHRILLALISSYPAGLRIEELIERVYYGAREPGDAVNNMHVIMGNMRPIIEKAGWTIPRHGRGAREAIYKLVPMK